MMSPVILIIIAVFVAILMYGLHEYVVSRFVRLEQAWRTVLAFERQKNVLIPALHKVSTSSVQFEQRTILVLKDARRALDQLSICEMDTKYLIDAENKTKRLIDVMQSNANDFPQIKRSTSYSELMKKLLKLQHQSLSELAEFNRSVDEFNRFIGRFPFSLINAVFSQKQSISRFIEADTEAFRDVA